MATALAIWAALLAAGPSAGIQTGLVSEESGISWGLATLIMAGILVPILIALCTLVWMLSSLTTKVDNLITNEGVTNERLGKNSDAIVKLKEADTLLREHFTEELRVVRHDVINRADAAYVRKDIHEIQVGGLAKELATLKLHTGCSES